MSGIAKTNGEAIRADVRPSAFKAPISGTIVTIHRYPGQAVNAGQAIMTINSEKGEYIVTYVRQTQVLQPTPGMAVNVHLRSAPRTIRSHIQSVGPAIE